MKTLASAYVNLLKTSIGSGVLSFPYLFKTYGIIPTFFFMIISGFFAAMGLVLLTICAHDFGRDADLSKLTAFSMPYAKIIVDFAVFVKCFGVSVSYMVIAKQMLSSFIETVFRGPTLLSKPYVCLLMFTAIIAPFTFRSKLDKLKWTSLIGVLSIIAVVLASIFRYFAKTEDDATTHLYTSPSMFWLNGFGKFVFSFTCHQNIFSIHTEMVDNSIPRMKKLIWMVSLSALVLYGSFGLSNYLIYGDEAKDNVLNNYPPDLLATIVRGLYVIVMAVSYPLQAGPARTYFLNMVHVRPKHPGYRIFYIIVTTVILTATYLIAVAGIKLGLIYSLVGATASTFMCLILPALFYLNIEVERSLFLTIAGYCAFLFGIFVFVTTLFNIYTGKY